MKGAPPELMARTQVWANSGRTLAAIRAAFDAHGPMLLPQLRVVTDLGAAPAAGLPPVEPPLARQMQLARLVAGLINRHPALGAGQPVAALAESLADLMTEMQSEGCGPDALARIEAGDHARHWQAALQFLTIAADFHLAGPPVDRAARQRAAADRLADDWAAGRDLPQAPVIVAGSTGSHGGTRRFMLAVAALPNGAVVLPGYDFDQPDAVWRALSDDAAADHPQSRYAPFSAAGPVHRWTDAPAPAGARNALVSLALRPAPITDQWVAEGPRLPDLVEASTDLTLIEADQPGDEAAAIAALIRAEVETGQAVTLIAADRGLTRRVQSALDRWHLVADDSAGRPLPLSAPGLLLRHLADLPGQRLTGDALLVLLKHPLAMTGSTMLPRNEALRVSRDLELRLRRKGPAFPDGAALRDFAARGDAAQAVFGNWLADLLDGLGDMDADRGARSVAARLDWLRATAERLAAGPGGDAAESELWREEAGEKALAVLDHLARHADVAPDMTPGDFAVLLQGQLQGQALRGDAAAHPLIRIRGPREARTAAHGTVILAGLNEGAWPAAPGPDPWLSRPMRLQAGLTLPERRIGLSAHDFQIGIGADRVILTRARRDAEAETIPSRWLNRLLNLMGGLAERRGPEAVALMRERGAHWLGLAAALARPAGRVDPAPRPCPVPPAPPFAELPVTDIARLIRDPYAIYARRVLALQALDPLHPEPGPAMRGQVLHRIVETLLKSRPTADLGVAGLRDLLVRTAAQVLADEVPWPSARAFWQARINGIADRIALDEVGRLTSAQPAIIEKSGRRSVAGLGFTLTARPDRIDIAEDGSAWIYDYKSGAPPSAKQVDSFEKQLPLQAAIVEGGGFDALGPRDVSGIAYIHLGGEGATVPRDLPDPGETWDQFVALITGFLIGETGFAALRAPEKRGETGDYAHLARFGEWDLTAPALRQKVGDDG